MKFNTLCKTIYESLQSSVWYHGTNSKYEWFSDDFTGEGNDQEGPGHYFTTNLNNAKTYGKHVVEVSISFDKVVPNKGKINTREIETLIKQSPRLETYLSNWDESPKIAFKTALDSIINNSTDPRDAFLQVWNDFYKYEGPDFVRGMKNLGYTGCIVERNGSHAGIPYTCQHAILYDLSKVTLLRRLS